MVEICNEDLAHFALPLPSGALIVFRFKFYFGLKLNFELYSILVLEFVICSLWFQNFQYVHFGL